MSLRSANFYLVQSKASAGSHPALHCLRPEIIKLLYSLCLWTKPLANRLNQAVLEGSETVYRAIPFFREIVG